MDISAKLPWSILPIPLELTRPTKDGQGSKEKGYLSDWEQLISSSKMGFICTSSESHNARSRVNLPSNT